MHKLLIWIMEKTTQFQRDRIIDIGKALGIICVALYHLIFMMLMTDATLVIPTPESQTSINFQFNFFNFVAFVLPFFYFASAFTYNPKKRTLKQDIIRKITHQLIPFVLITIFIIIIRIFLDFYFF